MSGTETCWLQVTSGRGPAECQYAVARLADTIVRHARADGLSADVIEAVAGRQRDCLLSALISLSGPAAERFAASWQGSVLWICKSPFRPGHKRKNWFVGVDALLPPDPVAARVDPRDVTFEAIRASGPGGQHVNTTDSAVRAHHRPSGITVLAREERSQHMNRKLALARIAGRLVDEAENRQAAAEEARWEKHNMLKRGDAVRTFEGPKFREMR
jgi:peptide chain release factor